MDEVKLEKSLQPLWKLFITLRDQASQLDENFRHQVVQVMNTTSHHLSSMLEDDQWQAMSYAWVAAFDEFAMIQDWPGRGTWMQQPLQVQYFQENQAGEGFFTRLSRMRQRPHQHLVVLQLMYGLLLMGFQGRYRLENASARLQCIDSLREQLLACMPVSQSSHPGQSNHSGQHCHPGLDPGSPAITFWRWPAAMLCTVFISWCALYFCSTQQAHAVTQQFQQAVSDHVTTMSSNSL
ncbi:MAG: hypothetical protein DHS20C10_13470 [marine bacterium B5-7]|nr:MAG: hypothetical protein DHS20C10_13470 [marine bacterium B5-7]